MLNVRRNVLFLYILMNDVYELNKFCMLYGFFFYIVWFFVVFLICLVFFIMLCVLFCFLGKLINIIGNIIIESKKLMFVCNKVIDNMIILVRYYDYFFLFLK